MIRAGAPVLLAALVLGAAAADAQQRFEITPQIAGRAGLFAGADPSAIVSAEIDFARLAREQGQWTGFARTADKDAVMFVPEVVNAQSWLKKQKNPAKSVSWAPDNIYIACDGSYAVSMGHATWPDGRKSRFVTLWRQQAKGDYKWVLDWGSNAPAPAGTDEDAIDGRIADCPARRARGVSPPVTGETPAQADQREWREGAGRNKRPKLPKYEVTRIPDPPPADGTGQSRDGSLHWQWTSAAGGARTLKVTVRYQGKDVAVVDDRFAAGE